MGAEQKRVSVENQDEDESESSLRSYKCRRGYRHWHPSSMSPSSIVRSAHSMASTPCVTSARSMNSAIFQLRTSSRQTSQRSPLSTLGASIPPLAVKSSKELSGSTPQLSQIRLRLSATVPVVGRPRCSRIKSARSSAPMLAPLQLHAGTPKMTERTYRQEARSCGWSGESPGWSRP